jgi:hypothetical protein
VKEASKEMQDDVIDLTPSSESGMKYLFIIWAWEIL